jgi:LmbE family N-acetylglucosaminyl deacetylase
LDWFEAKYARDRPTSPASSIILPQITPISGRMKNNTNLAAPGGWVGEGRNTVSNHENSVLVIIAHPDDEIFVSGTLCLLAKHGVPVDLICITNGEGANAQAGQDARRALGLQRAGELRSSSATLGIRKLVTLNFPDVPDPSLTWDMATLTKSIELEIRAAHPALILTHGPQGGYGHLAHTLAYQAVISASAEFSGAIFSIGGQVPGAFFSWQFDEPSDVIIDARPFLGQRIEALESHKSQIGFYLQPAFPTTTRKYFSAFLGYLLSLKEWGRKRIPIGTSMRFFQRFPREGLVLQRKPLHGPHYFTARFSNEVCVSIADKSH